MTIPLMHINVSKFLMIVESQKSFPCISWICKSWYYDSFIVVRQMHFCAWNNHKCMYICLAFWKEQCFCLPNLKNVKGKAKSVLKPECFWAHQKIPSLLFSFPCEMVLLLTKKSKFVCLNFQLVWGSTLSHFLCVA